jgi:hypothetical protein
MKRGTVFGLIVIRRANLVKAQPGRRLAPAVGGETPGLDVTLNAGLATLDDCLKAYVL